MTFDWRVGDPSYLVRRGGLGLLLVVFVGRVGGSSVAFVAIEGGWAIILKIFKIHDHRIIYSVTINEIFT